jgi:hypothetical protein
MSGYADTFDDLNNLPQGPMGPPGPQGPAGASGSVLKGSVNTVAELDALTPTARIGDTYKVNETGFLWSYVQSNEEPFDASWIEVGQFVGPAGADGRDGVDGDTGPQGPVGPQGPEGPIGPQGIPGLGITFVGRVETVADLPATAAQGDLYLINATGDAWIWEDDKSAFVNAGPIVGPTGAQGPKGDVGPQGPAGKDGLDAAAPIGLISLWYGEADTVPEGWAPCDGTNGTPDLTDRFILMGGSRAVGETGGSADAIVPAHTHAITDPGHVHSYNAPSGAPNNAAGGIPDYITYTSGETETATTGITIKSTGESVTNANLPPFFVLLYIMKIA